MDVIRQMAAVGVVMAVFAAVLWLLRRGGLAQARGWTAALLRARGPAPRTLERLERLPLSAQHTLHLVRLGERALLLASTPAGCTLVESIDCREIFRSQVRERS